MEKWHSHSDPTQIRFAYSHLTSLFMKIIVAHADTVITLFITPHIPQHGQSFHQLQPEKTVHWLSIIKLYARVNSDFELGDFTLILKLKHADLLGSKCKYMQDHDR
jgi:hypothetical protein